MTQDEAHKRKPQKRRRQKNSGRLFLRNGIFYGRYRSKESGEITFSTGIRSNEENARERAEARLLEETDVLRLKSHSVRLTTIRAMIETADEEIARRMSVKKATPLSQASDIFMASSFRPDSSTSQLERYSSYVDSLSKFLGDGATISSVDNASADRFARELASHESANTYNKYLNGLSLVWGVLSRTEKTAGNPWRDIKRKRLDTHVRRVITSEEEESVLATATGEARTLFLLGLYTGMRLGDCCHLEWSRVMEDRIVGVKTSKTGSVVGIPLHPRLKIRLDEIRTDGNGLVIPLTAAAYDRNKSKVSRSIVDLFSSCGITTTVRMSEGERARPDCTFHSLRHTFVSRCLAAGIPMHVVRAMVGHSTQKMTEHYTHLEDKTVVEAFRRMM